MTSGDRITDEDLTAWLDGEADVTLAARIEAALEEDPDQVSRIYALGFDRNALASGFDAMLLQAPAFPAEDTGTPVPPDATPGRSAIWRIAAALVLGIALGAGTSRFIAHGKEEADWVSLAAAYQALYVEQTLAVVNDTRAERDAQLDRVSAAVGVDLHGTPDSTELDYRRSQILGMGDKVIIQVAYFSEERLPVALCLTRTDDAPRGYHMDRYYGMEFVEWVQDGVHYVLIGNIGEGRLRKAAVELSTLVKA